MYKPLWPRVHNYTETPSKYNICICTYQCTGIYNNVHISIPLWTERLINRSENTEYRLWCIHTSILRWTTISLNRSNILASAPRLYKLNCQYTHSKIQKIQTYQHLSTCAHPIRDTCLQTSKLLSCKGRDSYIPKPTGLHHTHISTFPHIHSLLKIKNNKLLIIKFQLSVILPQIHYS